MITCRSALAVACIAVTTGCGTPPDATLTAQLPQLSFKTSASPAAASASPSTSTSTRPRTTPRSPGAEACHDETLDGTKSLRPSGPLGAPGTVAANSYMALIRRRGYLIVGVDQNTMLLSYFNPIKAAFEGFEVDIAREVAKAIFGPNLLPDQILLQAVLTNDRFDIVQRKHQVGSRTVGVAEDRMVDIVADAITVNCARRQKNPGLDFSATYFLAHQATLVPSNSTAKSLSDLAGDKVCTTKGGTAKSTVEDSGAIAFGVDARSDCLVALQTNEVDGFQSDDAILYGFHAQDPYTRILAPTYSDEPYGMAINAEHPEFVRFVNAVLDRIRANGRWEQIYHAWFGGLPGDSKQRFPAPKYRD